MAQACRRFTHVTGKRREIRDMSGYSRNRPYSRAHFQVHAARHRACVAALNRQCPWREKLEARADLCLAFFGHLFSFSTVLKDERRVSSKFAQTHCPIFRFYSHFSLVLRI